MGYVRVDTDEEEEKTEKEKEQKQKLAVCSAQCARFTDNPNLLALFGSLFAPAAQVAIAERTLQATRPGTPKHARVTAPSWRAAV